MAAGDRLRAERRVLGTTVSYMHHGIDVGDGTVVHARPHDFRRPFAGGRVERIGREVFAAGSPIDVVREPAAAFSPATIVARALRHVGRPGYCPVVDNCEHFATWCATGQRASRQVDLVVSRLESAARTVAVAVSARAVGGAAARATARLGLGVLVPAVVAGDVAALAAEWRACRAGKSVAQGRLEGARAGLATSVAACALVGLRAGPAGALVGAGLGLAVWAGGAIAASASGGRS